MIIVDEAIDQNIASKQQILQSNSLTYQTLYHAKRRLNIITTNNETFEPQFKNLSDLKVGSKK